MASTVRALILMFVAPPLLLLLWAHVARSAIGAQTDTLALIVVGLVGLAGVATAPWLAGTKTIVAIAYGAAALVALPFLVLLAVCSTGDCL
jgi:hypothetical protein